MRYTNSLFVSGLLDDRRSQDLRLGNEVVVALGDTCAVCACMYCRQPHSLSQESRCAGLDSNPAFPEYMSFHTLTWSVLCLQQKAYLRVTLVL